MLLPIFLFFCLFHVATSVGTLKLELVSNQDCRIALAYTSKNVEFSTTLNLTKNQPRFTGRYAKEGETVLVFKISLVGGQAVQALRIPLMNGFKETRTLSFESVDLTIKSTFKCDEKYSDLWCGETAPKGNDNKQSNSIWKTIFDLLTSSLEIPLIGLLLVIIFLTIVLTRLFRRDFFKVQYISEISQDVELLATLRFCSPCSATMDEENKDQFKKPFPPKRKGEKKTKTIKKAKMEEEKTEHHASSALVISSSSSSVQDVAMEAEAIPIDMDFRECGLMHDEGEEENEDAEYDTDEYSSDGDNGLFTNIISFIVSYAPVSDKQEDEEVSSYMGVLIQRLQPIQDEPVAVLSQRNPVARPPLASIPESGFITAPESETSPAPEPTAPNRLPPRFYPRRDIPRDPLTEPPNVDEFVELFYGITERHPRADQYPASFSRAMIEYCEDPYWTRRTVPLPRGVTVPPRPSDYYHIRDETPPPEDFNFVPPPGSIPLIIPPEAWALREERRRAHNSNL
uniref:Uncharacterized protein n=1 Tax=Caenorhabditis japonica TaxID=281687 RepID=A0A8R1HV24_CAEJA